MGVACAVDEDAARSVEVGGGMGLGGTTGVVIALGEAAASGDGIGVALKLGEIAGAGPLLLSLADEFKTPGEPAGSAATPGRVSAHHTRTTNNTCWRIRQSRLVISRREQVRRSSF